MTAGPASSSLPKVDDDLLENIDCSAVIYTVAIGLINPIGR